ncbi:DNA-3-methyladenine glycosylase [Abyssicoccus albus]|uniref:Putative 3-methyladenine DNA glycosylase n=1 Tax=Abyssicoccus albus TaxID=1817405 RepID=A0A3N5BCF1_9BACL|nr:DNA-3-methyladenine glycosylase [Abyssicoccus albus]RPF55133.1 DNA-3-methyladenine glycosylase [Abyssicoccus albus]
MVMNTKRSCGKQLDNALNLNLYQDTLDVAKSLLGKEVHSVIDGVHTSGYITEVEAYLGHNDEAAHGFVGRNKKNNEIFNEAGHFYIYSMHGQHCMNVVTQCDGVPEGVLIRAIEPNHGIDTMKSRRGRSDLATGPGKVTQCLGVKRDEHNGTLINSDVLWLSDGKTPKSIEASKRIGIDTKETAKEYLYRFTVKGHYSVSKRRKRDIVEDVWR